MPHVLAILVLAFSTACLAGPDNYQCIIEHEAHLADAGDLKQYPRPINVGERFAVDRSNGKVIGGPFVNSPNTRVQLVDRGGPGQAFKALYVDSVNPGKGDAEVLVISEHHAGAQKPFIALILTTVISGVCK